MQNWTRARKVSLVVHVAVVTIPLLWSTISALLFWNNLFRSWLAAVSIVAVVEVLALTGLVLYIARIQSPFHVLRHALPFISVVPLGWEVYGLLSQHQTIVVSSVVAVIVVAILVSVSWQCFRTIERLFIDPVQAAREMAAQQVENLEIMMAKLVIMNNAAERFAHVVTAEPSHMIAADDHRRPSTPPAFMVIGRPGTPRVTRGDTVELRHGGERRRGKLPDAETLRAKVEELGGQVAAAEYYGVSRQAISQALAKRDA